MTTAKTWIVNAVTVAAISAAAITSGAGPAAADDKDMLRALAGIAAVAVIAGALQNQNRAAQPVARAPVYQQPKPTANFYREQPRWDAESDWSARTATARTTATCKTTATTVSATRAPACPAPARSKSAAPAPPPTMPNPC